MNALLFHEKIAAIAGRSESAVWQAERRAFRKIIACARANPSEFPRLAELAQTLRVDSAGARQVSSQEEGRAGRPRGHNRHTGCANTPDLSPHARDSRPLKGQPASSGREGKR